MKILSISCGVGILPALIMQLKCRLAYQLTQCKNALPKGERLLLIDKREERISDYD